MDGALYFWAESGSILYRDSWMGRCAVEEATRSVDVVGLRVMRTQPPRDLMA